MSRKHIGWGKDLPKKTPIVGPMECPVATVICALCGLTIASCLCPKSHGLLLYSICVDCEERYLGGAYEI